MRAIRLLAALILWLSASTTSWAQGGLLTPVVAGWTGLQLIERAEQMIADAAEHARRVGDALLARSVTEADMLVKSIQLHLGSEIRYVIGELDSQTNLAYYRLAHVLDSFETAQSRAYSARDATVIDLAMLAGTLPFVQSLTFVERIDGLVQFDEGGDFAVSVTGTGLKPGIAGYTAQVRLNIDGQPIKFVREQSLPHNTRQLVIPRDALLERFDARNIVILPAVLTLTVSHSPRYSVGGLFDREETVEVPIHLSLFPKKAGLMTVEITRRNFEWVGLGWKSFQAISSRDCHPSRCHDEYELRCSVPGGDVEVEGYQRIVDLPRHNCRSLWGDQNVTCAYPGGWYSVIDPRVEPGGRVGSLTIEHWTQRNRYTILCNIEEYQEAESIVEVKSVKMFYDRTFEFLVPEKTTYWRIRGSTVTRRDIDILRDQPSDVLTFIRTYDEGSGRQRVAYSVNRPGIGF